MQILLQISNENVFFNHINGNDDNKVNKSLLYCVIKISAVDS